MRNNNKKDKHMTFRIVEIHIMKDELYKATLKEMVEDSEFQLSVCLSSHADKQASAIVVDGAETWRGKQFVLENKNNKELSAWKGEDIVYSVF